MKKDGRRVGLRISLGLVMLSLLTTLLGSSGSRAGSQTNKANLVRVVSPVDFILDPADPATGMVRLDFEFDRSVSYIMLTAYQPPPFKLPATAKFLNWGPCGPGAPSLLPGSKVPLHYDAFDSAGAKIGSGDWEFTMGFDTIKPAARIVSPKNNSFAGPGEIVEIVVAGEETKDFPMWQTGIRRLTLVEPAPAMNIQNSDEKVSSLCDATRWIKQHSFRYMVPRDAQSGQVLTLKAAAEDGAKNIGFATLDLIVQQGYAGLWATKGRFKSDQLEFTYTIEAAFSFTLNTRSGIVECGTASRPYCGIARVTFDPGTSSKGCVVARTPSSSVFKISAGGVRKGDELTKLTIRMAEPLPPAGYRFDCQSGRFDAPGRVDVTVGSIWEEGITIALPLRDHTTTTKHESRVISGGSSDVDHRVEIYAPRH